jgi:asparagine synthase (glutamine-hydrolysing)
MSVTLIHRGPDEEAQFLHENVGLAARRLSIIDVAGGHQPIFNEDRSVVLVFNGEIYNYRELITELEQHGHRFRSHSDAETIVHLYEEAGIECVHRLRGMFAFALYDLKQDRLFLVRDRLGIKPLYYWQQNGKLLFASEIKALLECEDVAREPYLPAIDAYLRLRYVPGPTTMFKGVYKLPPGHWMSYERGRTKTVSYWHPSVSSGAYRSDEHYQERFNELFTETIKLHLESDVPVGAYLSGGLDSSLVTAETARLTGQAPHTFSVGFEWEGDETENARTVADQLGTEHHELKCKPSDLQWLPQIIRHSDDPLGDPITLPTFLLSKLASRDVKVVLTGDGADEILGGYVFHRVMNFTHRAHSLFSGSALRRLAAPLVRQLPVQMLDQLFDYPAYLGVRGKRKVAHYLEVAAADEPAQMYESLITLFDDWDRRQLYSNDGLLHGGAYPATIHHANENGPLPFLDNMFLLQYQSWLPDNILARQDKMSMAHSVEARVPFLDHVLVEFMLTVPPHLTLGGLLRPNKVLARRFARSILPREAAARKKQPFYIPIETYFHTPIFREMVAATLNDEQVRKRGYFQPAAVADLVQSAEKSQDFISVKQVLSLVMLEMWHQIFIDRVNWN